MQIQNDCCRRALVRRDPSDYRLRLPAIGATWRGLTVSTLNNNYLPPLRRRSLGALRAAAMSLLLLGLSIGASAAQGTSGSRTHVFLMRGFANVFSIGMDQMGARLQRAGDYSLAVSVTDPAAQQQALPVRPHGASARVRIVPGPLVPARTRITGLPATLTAGACCNIT